MDTHGAPLYCKSCRPLQLYIACVVQAASFYERRISEKEIAVSAWQQQAAETYFRKYGWRNMHEANERAQQPSEPVRSASWRDVTRERAPLQIFAANSAHFEASKWPTLQRLPTNYPAFTLTYYTCCRIERTLYVHHFKAKALNLVCFKVASRGTESHVTQGTPEANQSMSGRV